MNLISIITDAFLADIFCKHWMEIPKPMLNHIANVIDYELVNERYIVNNEELRNVVKWHRMGKMNLIRILIRCLDQDIDVIKNIKPHLNKFDYNIKNLTHLLGRRPHYIEYFPIDLSKITTTEAATVMSIGESYFLGKVDLLKYNFNFRESMEIIKGYCYDRKIIEQVNYKSLKGYQVSEILINTGVRDIDILDISTLTNIDWINLLEHNPEMLKYCNYDKFIDGDIFYSIKLYCMFDSPDLSYLIMDRDLSEISPFGWEKLLIENPKKFLAHCNLSKLDENNWNNILKSHPELYIYKI